MRLLVHDYSGHPFQVQLSRWLAAQGHEVLHLYSSAIPTPQGAVAPQPDDPAGFAVEPVSLAAPVSKYNPLRRIAQERTYGRRLAARAAAFAPEVTISGNCSPQIQRALQATCRCSGCPFIYWVQDLYAHAAERHLRRRLPLLGRFVAPALHSYESVTIARSAAVVAITEDFVDLLAARGISRERISVIENWAPLDEVRPLPRDTAWVEEQGLAGRFIFLYSGTLGLKHNPSLLAALARHFNERPEVAVVVISNGPGRDFLETAKRAEGLDNLRLFDWQPYARLPEVLASGDVLVAILEPFAGVMAVPSKVLTYLCTRRPILAAIPPQNLAARTIARAGAGLSVAPDDEAGFVAAAERLHADATLRQTLANAGRDHAERQFDIDAIGGRFLTVIEGVRR